jgi:hypothetical protein
MPELSKGLKTTLFSIKGNLSDNAGFIADKGKDALNLAKEKASEGIEKAMQSGMEFTSDLLYRDLFKMFDKDDSGYLGPAEFKDLCKYMGLNLDDEKSLEIFAYADKSNNNCIEIQEFAYAMLAIQLEIARLTMEKLEITTTDLIWIGVITFIYLVLGLAFIFLGIFAFSKAESFNAVINSIIPLTAGVLSGSRKIDLKSYIEKIKKYIKSIISNFKE